MTAATSTDHSGAHDRPTSREVTPAQRWAMWMIGSEVGLFMMAMGLVGPLTFVPLFVSRLNPDPFAIGLVTAAFQLGWLPQLFVAGYVERSHKKWPWVQWFGSIERLPILVLAICALAAPSVGVPILIVVYLACFAQTMCGGFATTPWLEVISRAVPGRLRGRFLGGSTMVGTLLGAGAAAFAAPLLDSLEFPYGFAACWALAFGIFLVSLIPLWIYSEPPGPPPRPKRSLLSQLGDLPRIMLDDVRFRRFVGGLMLAALGTMSNGFLAVYAVSQLGASDDLVAWFTAALLIAQTTASLGCGWLADRFNMRVVGMAMGVSSAVQALVALFAPSAAWMLLAFLPLGAVQSGSMLARMAGPIDYAPHDRLPTYVALSGALVSCCTAAAPLLGGQLVAWLGYPWLFGLSALVALLAVPMLGQGAAPLPRPAVAVPVEGGATP